MSKYIIELNDNCNMVLQICITEHGNTYIESAYAENLEELNSDYINEHFGDLQDTAYQRGLEEGKKAFDLLDAERNSEYQRGFEDGKAVNDKGCEGCKYQSNKELTCPCSECANNFKNQWTAKDDKFFEFGDEIIDLNGAKGCVVSKDNEGYDTMYALFDGCRVPQYVTQSNYRKTGKHYDIDKILDKMKGTVIDNDTH